MQRVDSKIEITRENNGLGIVSYYVNGPNKIYYTEDQAYRNGSCLLDEGDAWSVQLHESTVEQ